MAIVEQLITDALDDDEAYVRGHCPNLEFRMTDGRLRYQIALRRNDPKSPMVVSNDVNQAWAAAAEAVRRELEGKS